MTSEVLKKLSPSHSHRLHSKLTPCIVESRQLPRHLRSRLHRHRTTFQQKELHLYGSDRIGIRKKLGNTDSMDPGQEDRTRGKTLYQLSNHLGNVLTTVTDQKPGILDGDVFRNYQAITVSATDYYPFGFETNDRTFSSSEYRFGFNGKEKDQNNEFGNLTHYDYGFRIYNQGIGKFLFVDPLTSNFPWWSPYQFDRLSKQS